MTITQSRWRIIHDSLGKQSIQVVEGIPLGYHGDKYSAATRPQLADNGWEAAQRPAKSDKLTRGRCPKSQAAVLAFKIDECVQFLS
jgi:hypothetical protein